MTLCLRRTVVGTVELESAGMLDSAEMFGSVERAVVAAAVAACVVVVVTPDTAVQHTAAA